MTDDLKARAEAAAIIYATKDVWRSKDGGEFAPAGTAVDPDMRDGYVAGYLAHAAEAEELVRAVEALDKQMEIVHADQRYIGVWSAHGNRYGAYSGPQYGEELIKLKDALAKYRGEK